MTIKYNGQTLATVFRPYYLHSGDTIRGCNIVVRRNAVALSLRGSDDVTIANCNFYTVGLLSAIWWATKVWWDPRRHDHP